MSQLNHSQSRVSLRIDSRNIASLTLNRPERHNAYDGEMIEALLQSTEQINAQQPVAVVLRGEGRSFQAGADLDWITSLRSLDKPTNLEASRKTTDAITGLNELGMPVLGLVHGSCYGGGTGIVAACDFVVAVEGTKFAIAEVKWGLSPGIILPLLVDAIGYRNLRRYALTAERFDTRTARDIGLVHEIAPSLTQANNLIDNLLDQIVGNDAAAVAETKIALAQLKTRAENFDQLIDQHVNRRLSDSAGEGLARFRHLNKK